MYEELRKAVEGDTEEERAEQRALTVAYRNAFNQDGRKVLKDRMKDLGLFMMVTNEIEMVQHNEALVMLKKLGIISDRNSIDRAVDALMNLPIAE